MNMLEQLESAYMRDDIPDFRAGDTVRVHVRVVEAGRERVQVFEGVVIARRKTASLVTRPMMRNVRVFSNAFRSSRADCRPSRS